jgi:hypothetical protein
MQVGEDLCCPPVIQRWLVPKNVALLAIQLQAVTEPLVFPQASPIHFSAVDLLRTTSNKCQ